MMTTSISRSEGTINVCRYMRFGTFWLKAVRSWITDQHTGIFISYNYVNRRSLKGLSENGTKLFWRRQVVSKLFHQIKRKSYLNTLYSHIYELSLLNKWTKTYAINSADAVCVYVCKTNIKIHHAMAKQFSPEYTYTCVVLLTYQYIHLSG